MEALLQMAALRQEAKFIGVSVNTRNLTPEAAADEIKSAEDRFQLPACDVYRQGAERLVQAAIDLRKDLNLK